MKRPLNSGFFLPQTLSVDPCYPIKHQLMDQGLRIGCSGFYYKEWKEIFYPAGLPQRSWFEYYCQHFNTIEINSSFYKQPSLKSFAAWYDTSGADFLFSIKAPRTITHYNRFKHAHELVNDFYQVAAEGLKEKLGCILFQMPPSFVYTEANLDGILESLQPGFNNVAEFRHISWWREDVMEILQKNNITFSGVSHPSALPDEIIDNNSIIYYRFHGKPVLFKSLYSLAEIKSFAAALLKTNKPSFVYFNNTWGTSALINAGQLKNYLNTIRNT